MIIGAQFYDAGPEGNARQAHAMDALAGLAGVVAIDLQWQPSPSPRPWIRAEAALREDSCGVTRAKGRVKPITTDVFDALAAIATRDGHRYFLFVNSDIVVTPAAVELIERGGRQGYALGRMDVEADGRERGVLLSGLDGFAFDVRWWQANRWRFRPYIIGEAIWDDVYAAIMMCHGDGLIANRRGEIRHAAHPMAWGKTLFADYNGYLSALDSRYFSLWVEYYTRLVEARGREASEEEERAIARDVFVWRRSIRRHCAAGGAQREGARALPPSARGVARRGRAGSAVVAELQRDAEVVLAQRLDRFLQLVLRGRGHAHLVGLDRRLHLLQLLVLQELHDLLGRLDRDALLDRDDAAHGAAGGGSDSPALKFLMATPRRTRRVCTISHSAFILNSSSASSVRVMSVWLSVISALAPLKS